MTMRMRHQQRTRRSLIICKAMIANDTEAFLIGLPQRAAEAKRGGAAKLYHAAIKLFLGSHDNKTNLNLGSSFGPTN